MSHNYLTKAIAAANLADDRFSAALQVAGFKSRWTWHLRQGPQSVADAYLAKVDADWHMHKAFEHSRKVE